MAKRATKEAPLPQIVDEGGILYERRIYHIEPRVCMLVHTDSVRYDKPLEKTSWSTPDQNDHRCLTTLLYTHEKYVDANPV